ncbi:MAG: hypothetical protein GYB31_16405 [Bacteroidetes bacterium]|nr:hypothetical protein [Bacteroidota bacterium]
MPKTLHLLLSLPSTAQTFVNETNRWHNADCCFNFGNGMINHEVVYTGERPTF